MSLHKNVHASDSRRARRSRPTPESGRVKRGVVGLDRRASRVMYQFINQVNPYRYW